MAWWDYIFTMMRMLRRLLLVVCLVAAILVPATVAPAKTVVVPRTLARSVTADGSGRAVLAFPATHIAFKWFGPDNTKILFREVLPSGNRGDWNVAYESHDLEDGPRHFSGIVEVDRIRELEWKAVAPDGRLVKTVTADYMNTLDGPEVRYTIPAVAAANDAPDIVTRAEWGADESYQSNSGGCERVFHPLQQLFVHHTAGSNGDSDPYATMRAVYSYHTRSRGWCDIGYNFVVAQDGTIFEGRWARNYAPWEIHNSEDATGRVVAGAHVSGYNSGSAGVSLMGNFMNFTMPAAQRAALVEMLAYEAERHGLDPLASHTYRNPESGSTRKLPVIAGHKDAGQTSCPGDRVYKNLGAIRKEVALAMDGVHPTPSMTLRGGGKFMYGTEVGVEGTLVDAAGLPMMSTPVTVWVKPSRRKWAVVDEVMTRADGSFSADHVAGRNAKLQAVYNGDASTSMAQSPRIQVKVKPHLVLEPEGGEVDGTGTARYASGTRRPRFSGVVTPNLKGQTINVLFYRVGENGAPDSLVSQKLRTLDASSRFYVRYKPQEGARYRVVAWYRKGGGYWTSRSESLFFQVGG
jgi:hypothetical protein